MLVDLLITQACILFSQDTRYLQYQPACNPTLTAASIQTDVKPFMDKTQGLIEQKVKDKTGEQLWWAYGVYYTFVQTHKIQINSPLKPIADSINFSSDTNFNTVNLGLTWTF